MKIGIYCGSFNPVHKGHLKIVREILKTKIVNKVLIVPTKDYWDKKLDFKLKDRIKMLQLYQTKNIEIETKLNNVDSTYEGLTKYQIKHPNDELYLILGADNLVSFDKWVKYQEVLKYPFIIIKRDDLGIKFIKQKMKEFNKKNYYILDIDTIDISSTYIRNNINNPKKLINKLDPRIYNYLKDNNLIKSE